MQPCLRYVKYSFKSVFKHFWASSYGILRIAINTDLRRKRQIKLRTDLKNGSLRSVKYSFKSVFKHFWAIAYGNPRIAIKTDYDL